METVKLLNIDISTRSVDCTRMVRYIQRLWGIYFNRWGYDMKRRSKEMDRCPLTLIIFLQIRLITIGTWGLG
jgi:hypothetical protein